MCCMELHFFLKGAVLGFSTPAGPIGILCIRRTLQYGRMSGLSSGLGAVIADTIYGIIAIFGLSMVMNLLLAGQFWLRVMGGAFLVYLGFKILLSKTKEKPEAVTHKTLFNDFLSTFFLTMTNPLTFLTYFGIFAGFGFADTKGNHLNGLLIILGIFLGASMWWLILTEGVFLFRKKIGGNLMVWINRIAGVIIIGFGIAAWISLRYDLGFLNAQPPQEESPANGQSVQWVEPQAALLGASRSP